ncbi:MAG TPA: GNAT family N-acetyltransferase [Anaerolineales bacterium]|nr:GNAT family N-acetyltransferase [Anaerolineales bacterium]
MEIQPASLRDLNALRRLEQACFKKDAWPLLDLIAVLTWPDVIRLKAVENGELIGFVAGDPRPAEGASWVATIAVDPYYQRRGIGRALLQACEERMNLPRMRLTVRMSNQGAISLYEKEGYRSVDIWKRYYHDGEDGLVMEKTIHSK